MEIDATTGAPAPDALVSAAPVQEKVATATCHLCGCESPLVEFFRKTSNGPLCPRCLPKQGNRDLLKAAGLLVGIGAFLSFTLSASMGSLQLAPLLNLSLLFPLTLIMIFAHEAVHALAALLLAGRVFEVMLGFGPMRWSTRWRGTRISLRRGLIAGLCMAAFPQQHLIRLRWLIFIMAPLTAQIVLVGLLLPFVDATRIFRGLAVVEMLVLVNIVLVATNLFPWKVNAMMATDGYWIWQLLRGRKTAAEFHAFYYLFEGYIAFEYKDYPAMLAACETGLALHPQDDLLKNMHATAFLAQDRYAEAVAYFDQFLAQESAAKPSAIRGLYLGNRAVALFHLGLEPDGINADQLALGYASIKEAFFLLPWIPQFELIRALSLNFQGHHQIAIDLLQKAMPQQENDSSRAIALAFMALAQHGLGQTAAAHESLAQAWRVYPKGGRTMQRVGEIVGAAGE